MTSQNTQPTRPSRPIPYEEAQTVIAGLTDQPMLPAKESSEAIFSQWLEQNQLPAPSLFQRMLSLFWALLGR